jgi:cyclopropane fatty-acyl-phospholipid synthase-like methyltransferase
VKAAEMSFPYIDMLLKQLAAGHGSIEKSFGRHIHWGYWPDPATAKPSSAEDYGTAAERLSLELIALANVSPGMRVLDTGCGFGGTMACMEERIDGLDLVGLNIDPRQLQRAATLVRPNHRGSMGFIGGNACSLPFCDNSFDRVMAVECIFHFPSRRDFLNEVKRVLRPGGSLVISDFVSQPAFVPISFLARMRPLHKLNVFGPCDVSCTPADYRRLAAQTGLKITVLRDITPHTLPTYAFLKHLIAGPTQQNRALSNLNRVLIGLLDFYGRSGLLRYSLLRFEKSA